MLKFSTIVSLLGMFLMILLLSHRSCFAYAAAATKCFINLYTVLPASNSMKELLSTTSPVAVEKRCNIQHTGLLSVSDSRTQAQAQSGVNFRTAPTCKYLKSEPIVSPNSDHILTFDFDTSAALQTNDNSEHIYRTVI